MAELINSILFFNCFVFRHGYCVLEQNGVVSALPCRCRRGADRRRQSRTRDSAAIGARGFGDPGEGGRAPQGSVAAWRAWRLAAVTAPRVLTAILGGQLANGMGPSVLECSRPGPDVKGSTASSGPLRLPCSGGGNHRPTANAANATGPNPQTNPGSLATNSSSSLGPSPWLLIVDAMTPLHVLQERESSLVLRGSFKSHKICIFHRPP